jgi:hypothetical protein
MIGADVVLVDGLLDQPHAEQAGIKRQILSRFRRNRGQVVNACQLHRMLLARRSVAVQNRPCRFGTALT